MTTNGLRKAMLCAFGVLLGFAWKPPAETRRSIAFTFDDLPLMGGRACDREMTEVINNGLLDILRKHQVPAAGFVTESRSCDDEQLRRILGAWLDAGHELGNHTLSHWDYNRTPIEKYGPDILSGERMTRELLEPRGKRLRYFRHPFLHSGQTSESKRQLTAFLDEHGYQVAPVTLDNQEWVYAGVYQRAHYARDAALKDRVARAYLQHIEDVTAHFEKRSVAILGREPAQTLLLHANLLNSEHLEDLIAMFRRRGYRFISFPEALRDEAYRLPDPYVGAKGISWLHRWGMGKGIPFVEEPQEHAWVGKLLAAPGL